MNVSRIIATKLNVGDKFVFDPDQWILGSYNVVKEKKDGKIVADSFVGRVSNGGVVFPENQKVWIKENKSSV